MPDQRMTNEGRGGAERTYDVVVIGAGPVGENVADRAVQGGLSAVIVEDRLVGGQCSYWACMPSKALLRSGAARRAALAVDGARQAVTGRLDAAAVLARRDEFVSHWDDSGQVDWLEEAGIDLVRGRGRIDGEKRVVVESRDGEDVTLVARHAVAVCTGSRPKIPDIPGLADAKPWTSDEAVAVKTVPRKIIIIGGGVVACELATAFTDLGTDVTVLARSGLLGNMESFAGERVAERLRERRVTLRVDAEVTRVDRDEGGVRVVDDLGNVFRAAEIVIATGREPRLDEAGLEAIGLGTGESGSAGDAGGSGESGGGGGSGSAGGSGGSGAVVDETLRVLDGEGTAIPWLYAVGDANGRVLLTHQGKYQARAVGDVIAARAKGEPVSDGAWGRHVATADHEGVPQVVFSSPEVAAVGLTEAAARDKGYRVRVVETDLGAVAGASLHADGYKGHAQMVVDEDEGVVLGVTLVGLDVAEMIHAATIAVVGEVPLERLWHAVPAYPTMSEVWLRLLEAYGR